ncbi:Mediator of RNA polymerase II transcription subunit 18, variant 2 [Chamberlinius hualienensis]
MELISSNLKSIIPSQEYLLQGSILDVSCEVLLHRLRGLCDNCDTGTETFHDHEMVFQIQGPNPQPVVFRARRAMDQDSPWHLRYVGQPEYGDKTRPTLVRSYIEACTSNNLVPFLNELGFKLDHEYVLKGYMFRKGRMKITVSKVFLMMQPSNTANLEALSDSYLVELSVVAPTGQDAVADDMKAFAEQLKP